MKEVAMDGNNRPHIRGRVLRLGTDVEVEASSVRNALQLLDKGLMYAL
jgi:hypothetical protein